MCVTFAVVGYGLGQPVAVLVMGMLAIAAERESIRLKPGVEVSIASLVYVFAAVVLGPLDGALVAGAGLLADLPRRDAAQPGLRWGTWTSNRMVVAGLAGLSAMAVMHQLNGGFLAMFAAVSAALAIDSVLDIGFAATTTAIRGTSSWLETAGSVAPAAIVSVPMYAPMVSVLAYA